MNKIGVAVIGPGNIGTDLMLKVLRSTRLEMRMMVGVVESAGIERARQRGVPATTRGIDDLLARKDELGVQIVFDATGAAPHLIHAPLLRQAGLYAIDLTPAAVGPYLVPSVNLERIENEMNINMVTCGGQATVPIVYAISRVANMPRSSPPFPPKAPAPAPAAISTSSLRPPPRRWSRWAAPIGAKPSSSSTPPNPLS